MLAAMTRPSPSSLAAEVLDYYLQGKEDGRLRSGPSRLELWRIRARLTLTQ